MTSRTLHRLLALLVCVGIVAGAISNCHADWDFEAHLVIEGTTNQ